MPFPVEERFVTAAEEALGTRLPQSLRNRLMRSNGGEIEVFDDDWLLYAVRDPSDRKRLARSMNDIVSGTKSAREWHGFQSAAVAIAENGTGDLLALLPVPTDPSLLGDECYWWDHETGEVQSVGSIGDLVD